MRAVVQRVSEACVVVGGRRVGAIGDGLLVYLGVEQDDAGEDSERIADKVRYLRVFEDAGGKLNRDVAEAGGAVLVVSAFSVQADARKGRRPTFERAASGDRARVLYELFCERLARLGVAVERGVFGEMMDVQSVNAGPVCILLDSKKVF